MEGLKNKMTHYFKQWTGPTIWGWLFTITFASVLFLGCQAFAQEDQAAITGSVTDSSGAFLPGAQVTLTNIDTGLILHAESNSSGIYVFSPVTIGNYKVSATAGGFQTTTQEHVHLSMQQRLNVNIALTPGTVSQTVTINSAPPLLQTEEASVSQVLSAETINQTPLNGRNWVFIAQLTAGTVPSTSAGSGTGSQASRGGGTGDFFANGLRATQNNFILDGIDNNVNVADFTNGASYSIRSPPDALAEFQVNTSDYSAEFGHSAGAVVNASTKSGTNQIHGDLWEYFRNTDLNAKDWDQTSIPAYHENQFGATAGFPIIRNKLFYFGDAEANRISAAQPLTLSVPTALMRQGNFSELLNTNLTGQAQPIQLYQPNSGGTTKLSCNGQNNVFCASQIDPIAKTLLNLFPLPNVSGGTTFNNYLENAALSNNNWMWDQRVDWNISAKDQSFIRYSYDNEHFFNAPPLGDLLLGISDYPAFQGALDTNLIQQFDLSETHIFSPSLVNSFRFGYSYGHFTYEWPNSNLDVSSQLGLGGVPFGPNNPNNGAIPVMGVTGLSAFGPSTSQPSNEDENDPQLLDNVTKIIGNHSLKFGVAFQHLQIGLFQPNAPTGNYSYTGLFTSNVGASFTGYGVADFLANQMDSGSISTDTGVSDTRWYDSAYAQDDWRITHTLTLNLGLRWDFFQPMTNSAGDISNLVPSTPFGEVGTGSGTLLVPAKDQSKNLFPAAFTSLLAQDNVTIKYVNSTSLVTAPKFNFSPRLGFAYQLPRSTVIRGGYGIFYGGFESVGGQPIMVNYPSEFTATVVAPNCIATSCNSNGITLENGFTNQLASGIQNFISTPVFNVSVYNSSIPYAEEWNLAAEHQFGAGIAATLGYVGNLGRNLEVSGGFDSPDALVNPASNSQLVKPFPNITAAGSQAFNGRSNYNALQAKLQKSLNTGLNFLATYTWAHALDDSKNSGGIESGVSFRNLALIPISEEYTNSSFDVRQRFTFNSSYQLPFGRGRAYMNKGGWSDAVAGGWSGSLVFFAQTGIPFTVTPDITPAAGGTTPTATLIADPFKPGGTPPASNPGITCAQTTRNRVNWYNPCAFANPLPGTDIPTSGPGSQMTGTANAIAYLGGKANTVYGPGFERTNLSVFKNFHVWHEQNLQFRVDSFNLLNHPSFNNPSVLTNNTNGGQITQSDIFQPDTPDSRFFQLSLKYTY